MIDWVKALIPWRHSQPINDGQITRTRGDGSVEWSVNARQPILGSYDTKIHIHSDHKTWNPATGLFEFIVFDGNPVKFFQGHNLWGTNDLIGLMAETCHRISGIIDLPINDLDWLLIVNGAYELKRVDSTIMVDLNNLQSVKSFLYSAERLAHMRYKGQGVMKEGTLYFAPKSRRESLKMYAKGEEIRAKGHELPLALQALPQIYQWADSKLRIEDVMRAMELNDRGLRLACNWDENTAYEIVFKALSGIDMSEQHTLTTPVIAGLPPRLVLVYTAWKEGHDLRAMFNRMTFYRYRRQLMDLADIDIAIKQPKETKEPTNLIEFRRVLSPVLCLQVPEWAIGTDLYFEPRAKIAR